MFFTLNLVASDFAAYQIIPNAQKEVHAYPLQDTQLVDVLSSSLAVHNKTGSAFDVLHVKTRDQELLEDGEQATSNNRKIACALCSGGMTVGALAALKIWLAL